MIKVVKIEPQDDFRVRFTFSDGTRGILDCRPIIAEGGPMVEPLRDPAFFARVFIELGAPTWPNGFDIAPWTAKAEIEAAGALETSSVSAAE
jgi:Protein of unknown function (DUF2442)